MSNRLLPYDTIIKAHEGDPIAIQAVLDRYAGYIRYFSKMNGYYNSDMEDYIRTKLIESLFKFQVNSAVHGLTPTKLSKPVMSYSSISGSFIRTRRAAAAR